MFLKKTVLLLTLLYLTVGVVWGSETYSPETLAVLKWGAGDKDFGLPTEKEAGPKYFTFAPSGEIYILDAVKKKILVFDSEGKFEDSINLEVDYDFGSIEMEVSICVDSRKNIYIFPHWWGFFIDKFDKRGKLINRYIVNEASAFNYKKYLQFKKDSLTISLIPLIGKNIAFQGIDIFNDQNNSVYVSANKDGTQVIVELSNKLHKSYTRRPSRGKALNGNQWFDMERKVNNIYKLRKLEEDKVVKEIEIELPGRHVEGKHHYYMRPKAEDFKGNIYVDIYENRYDEVTKGWVQKEWVAKYDGKGNLLGVIRFERNTPKPIMDFTGNFYQIIWDRPGDEIKFIKCRGK